MKLAQFAKHEEDYFSLMVGKNIVLENVQVLFDQIKASAERSILPSIIVTTGICYSNKKHQK